MPRPAENDNPELAYALTQTVSLSTAPQDSFAPEIRGPVEIVDGPTRQFANTIQDLLRVRLRAAALVICIGFGLFLIRSFIIERPLQAFHTAVVFVEGICVGVLAGQRSFSAKQLRLFEVVIFGLPFLFFVPYQHLFMLYEAQRNSGDPTLTLAAFKSVASYWLVTMVFYGLIVPNNWKRATMIFVPLTLVLPIAAICTAQMNEVVAQVVTFDQVSDVLLVLVIGAICSIFGSHIMSTLREEVFEAKQFGQYRLVERLGAGGMGQVYLAEHQLLKRPCAIKLIHPRQAGDPTALRRFEREVHATAKLTHWNTIDIYDYGRTDDGTFYYVMEYLPGMDLSELVTRYGPLPPARVVHIMRQMCNALWEAHSAGMVHRDIKGSNILLTEQGGIYDVAKLLDFGLVKPVNDQNATRLTQLGSVSGTPLFMAPEQATGGSDLDQRSDIYSLGAVAYMLLTGAVPFDRESAIEVMAAHVNDTVVPMSQMVDTIPNDLEVVILRCMAKRPADRFGTARQLERALAQCECADQWTQEEAAGWWATKSESAGNNEEGPTRDIETATPAS